MRRFLTRLVLVSLVLAGTWFPAFGQTDHPAAGVALRYLRLMALRDYTAAVELVQMDSLEELKVEQIDYIRAAPTIADEETILARLGAADIFAIEKMSPAEVFVRHNRARFPDDEEGRKVVRQLAATLEMKVLGAVPESDTLMHVCIRSHHQRTEKNVSALDLVSVVKSGKNWTVSLDAQEPTFLIKSELEGREK